MSITFTIESQVIGEIPVEAFDSIKGFDDLLEEKTGKFFDLYGDMILYRSDIELLVSGYERLSRKNRKLNSSHPAILLFRSLLNSIGNTEVIRVLGE